MRFAVASNPVASRGNRRAPGDSGGSCRPDPPLVPRRLSDPNRPPMAAGTGAAGCLRAMVGQLAQPEAPQEARRRPPKTARKPLPQKWLWHRNWLGVGASRTASENLISEDYETVMHLASQKRGQPGQILQNCGTQRSAVQLCRFFPMLIELRQGDFVAC